MRVEPISGMFDEARFIPSPNCDARPAGAFPEVLVIHAISLPPGEFGGPWVEQLFCNDLDARAHPFFELICDLRVSAHALIRRGGQLTQFVPLHLRAWHAGESRCEGRSRVNDFSIGVELEGCDEEPFENIQYATLSEVCRALMRVYPAITPARTYGHSDIAPGRKTDPGPHFDWVRFRASLNETPLAAGKRAR